MKKHTKTTVDGSTNKHPAYLRGLRDARSGKPQREHSVAYLRGFHSKKRDVRHLSERHRLVLALLPFDVLNSKRLEYVLEQMTQESFDSLFASMRK
jgi:hypothetical protein